MNDLFAASLFFGGFLTVAAYQIGLVIKRKLKLPVFNPILIAVVLIVLFLVSFRIDYDVYNKGAQLISQLLTPATICLAIPLYEQFGMLKKNWLAAFCGILAGVITSMTSVLLLSLLFRFDHALYASFLPKSITTAIGMDVSRELGGYVSLTVAVIIATGILGNILAETVCRIFRISHPVAKGIAIGSASHAIGTTKALQMGETEGAMSSLSIVTSGILTVLFAMVYGGMM